MEHTRFLSSTYRRAPLREQAAVAPQARLARRLRRFDSVTFTTGKTWASSSAQLGLGVWMIKNKNILLYSINIVVLIVL